MDPDLLHTTARAAWAAASLFGERPVSIQQRPVDGMTLDVGVWPDGEALLVLYQGEPVPREREWPELRLLRKLERGFGAADFREATDALAAWAGTL